MDGFAGEEKKEDGALRRVEEDRCAGNGRNFEVYYCKGEMEWVCWGGERWKGVLRRGEGSVHGR